MKNYKLLVLVAAVMFLLTPSALRVSFAAEPAHDHMGKIIKFVPTVGTDGVQHVEIVGGEYYYDPNYIVVKVNIPVELKIKKAGGFIPHDAIVNAPEAGIDFRLALTSDFQIVKFTPTKIGKYSMYCDKKLLWFASHREKGMEGTIEVVE